MSTYLNADTAVADEVIEVYAAACSFECAILEILVPGQIHSWH